MRELTREQIDKLASRRGAKRMAVENFLGTLGKAGSMQGELMNMYADAQIYRWNYATTSAIRRGIEIAYMERDKNDTRF